MAGEYGIKPEMLKADGHTSGVGQAKAVAMELVCRLTGMTQREVGSRYGGISSYAVNHTRRRVKTETPAEVLDNVMKSIRCAEPQG